MNEGESPLRRLRRIPPGQRLLLIVTGTVLVVLLAIAGGLTPDSQGHGTHEQLGLPPCTLRVLAGIRCPSCGMTTAWAHVVRGRVDRGLQANVGGSLLAVTAVLVAPWALASGILGRRLGPRLDERLMLVLGTFLLLVTLADWIVRLVGMRGN